MKAFFVLISLMFVCSNSNAQVSDSVLKYPILIKFQSKCCGVPEQAALDSAILLYKIHNHIRTIKADKISPMGREGEYYIGFINSNFMLKHRKSFASMLKSVCKKMKDPGYVDVEENAIIKKSDLPIRVDIEHVIF